MPEASNLEQTALGRREFLKKILLQKKIVTEISQDKIAESFNTNPIKKYHRRKFLEISAKGATSLITTVALEKLSNFVSDHKAAFAQQVVESITDQKCQEFFKYCHNRISEIDRKSNQKTDELVLELAEFQAEFAVSVYSFFSSSQTKKFSQEIDYVRTKMDDLRTDRDWDLDAESNINGIKNIPSWLLPVKEYGDIVASETKDKSNPSTHLSIIHFGDVHDWDSTSDSYSATLNGHDQIYKMFELLHKQKYDIVGYEDESDIETVKKLMTDQLVNTQNLIDIYGDTHKIKTKYVQEIQNRLKHASILRISKDHPNTRMVPIDVYAPDTKISHERYSFESRKAYQAYSKAMAFYYDIKHANSKGDINTAAKELIQKEKILAELEKKMYDERSKHAYRRMIAEMLLVRKLKGAVIFGVADGKYFLEETRRMHEDPEIFLKDLKGDNEKIHKKLLSTYSLEELKQLSIELYMVIPHAFRPYG